MVFFYIRIQFCHYTWNTVSWNILHGTSYMPHCFWGNILLLFSTFLAISRQSHHEDWLSFGPQFGNCPRKHDLSHSSTKRNTKVLNGRILWPIDSTYFRNYTSWKFLFKRAWKSHHTATFLGCKGLSTISRGFWWLNMRIFSLFT